MVPPDAGHEIHQIHVAGVTYENRAPAIRRLRAGESVALIRRPNHFKDRNAIEVLSSDGCSLGYVPAKLAARIAGRIDRLGGCIDAIVTDMHPGEADGSYLSLAIRFELACSSSQESPPPAQPPADPPSRQVAPVETNVAGMKYEGRMRKAENLKPGDPLILVREPGNPHDRNAIAVRTMDGVQIGYLSRHLAFHLAESVDATGGVLGAKVASVWKQPVPNFHMSVQVTFIPPPGATIPKDLNSRTEAADSPFRHARSLPPEAGGIPEASTLPSPLAQVPQMEDPNTECEPSHEAAIHEEVTEGPAIPPDGEQAPDPGGAHATAPPPQLPNEPGQKSIELADHLGSLTPEQREELASLLEPHLAPLIVELYLGASAPWPEFGFEAKDRSGICTGSMLEVAWPDFKIGISLPGYDTGSFLTLGWTVFPATEVTGAMIRQQISIHSGNINPAKAGDTESSTSSDSSGPSQGFRHGPFIDDEPDEDVPH